MSMKMYEIRCILDNKPIRHSYAYRVLFKLCGREFARRMTREVLLGEVMPLGDAT